MRIKIVGTLVSAPYVGMAIILIIRLGINFEANEDNTLFAVKAGERYKSPPATGRGDICGG